MRLFFAILRQEWLMQRRALRFRAAAVIYVGLNSLPSILSLIDRHNRDVAWSATAFHAQTQIVQPFLTVLLAILVAGHESGFEAQERRWPVLSSAPLSSGAFLWRRWLAMLVLLLPLTVLPMLTAVACALFTQIPFDGFAAWLSPWLLHIVPLTVAASAGWLGLTTIAGTELGALAIWFFGWSLFLGLLNKILLNWRMRIEDLTEWIGFDPLNRWVFEIQRGFPHGHAATSAPYDVYALLDWALPRGFLGLALGLGFLGLGIVFVRRTRRDLKPQPIHDKHPLRTLLPAWHRFRQRYAPDAALSLVDRGLFLATTLLFLASLGFLLDRQQNFKRLGAERYRVETELDFPPLPQDIRPQRLRVEGHIKAKGRLAVEAQWTFRHDGDTPQAKLPFSLNQGLALSTVTAPTHQVSWERSWDRILLTLEPELMPGEILDLHLVIEGSPRWIDQKLFYSGQASFVTRWEGFLHARFVNDLADLSRSETQRAISPRRLILGTTSLVPMPRYSPWTLTPPPEQPGEPGREVPEESIDQLAKIELELKAPADLFLASHCGDASHIENGETILRSSCRSSIIDLMVSGGPQQLMAGEGQVQLAALPAHRQLMESHRESLESIARLGERAWPDLPPIEKLVAVEWPPVFERDLRRGLLNWEPSRIDAHHRLILIPESRIIQNVPLVLNELVGELLVDTLLARRVFERNHAVVIGEVLNFLMLRRMGLNEVDQATVSVGGPWVDTLRIPLLNATRYSRLSWTKRLPALMVELEHRLGSESLYAGLEAFLNATESPGTVREAIRHIEALAGTDLDTFYEDYFAGNALPRLQLQDVELRTVESGFEVSGKVLNTGTGHPRCPVVVKGELETQRVDVDVQPETTVDFAIRTRSRPHTLQLDPDRTCHRLLTAGSIQVERISLENL